MKIKKKEIIITSILFVLAVIFTVLTKLIDVKAIGPQNSSVGFAGINNFFTSILGYNVTLYNITEILGLIPLLVAVFYVGYGVFELIKYKSFKKVNKNIYLLGAFYSLTMLVYLLFEVVVINYRPVLMDGVLEASYPSSHTLMSVCFLISAVIVNNKLFNKNLGIKIFNVSCVVLSAIIVVLRFVSGVHWFTDILGGLIISAFLISLFILTLNLFERRNKKEQ